MRRVVLALLLAMPPLAFAPAPFPKAGRPAHEPEQAKRLRLLHEYRRQLDGLGVKWQVAAGPRGDVVRFRVRVAAPNGGAWGMSGEHPVRGGDLAGALRQLAEQTRDFAREAAGGDRR